MRLRNAFAHACWPNAQDKIWAILRSSATGGNCSWGLWQPRFQRPHVTDEAGSEKHVDSWHRPHFDSAQPHLLRWPKPDASIPVRMKETASSCRVGGAMRIGPTKPIEPIDGCEVSSLVIKEFMPDRRSWMSGSSQMVTDPTNRPKFSKSLKPHPGSSKKKTQTRTRSHATAAGERGRRNCKIAAKRPL